MTNKLFYFTLILFSFLSCQTKPEAKGESLENLNNNKIDSLANRYLELNRFSGAILVSKNDSIIYNRNFGLANYENNIEFTNKTAFKIGRISELITAGIIHKMEKEGAFRLSDSISEYIPDIKNTFTIEDLLNHKTNLPTIQQIQEENPELDYETVVFTNLALSSSKKPEYSELNYNILGMLIEKISEKTFQENLANYGNDLKLENTFFNKTNAILATGYLFHNYRGTGLELQKAPVSNLEITFSSNGLKSTISDLAKIINASSKKSLEIDGYMEDDGFSYSLIHNPETKTTIIILSNRRHPVAEEISNSIEAILKNKNYRLPLARKPVKINKNLLKEYAGNYALNENMNIEVSTKNDSLFLIMGPNTIYLVPQSSNQFYMEDRDASMRFLKNTDSLVYQVELLDAFLSGNKINRKNK